MNAHIEHLLGITERGSQPKRDEQAVNNLVGMIDPNMREPAPIDSRVKFLVDLTNRELAREQQ